MSLYGGVDALFAYALSVQVQQKAKTSGGEAGLEGLLRARVRGLADILADIEGEIRSRTQLSKFILVHIDTYYCYLKSKLHDLYRWPLAINRTIDQRRLGIEKLLETLHAEKRRELTTCWQDIARLRSERRTWLKQYSDLVERLRLVLPDSEQGLASPGPHRPPPDLINGPGR